MILRPFASKAALGSVSFLWDKFFINFLLFALGCLLY